MKGGRLCGIKGLRWVKYIKKVSTTKIKKLDTSVLHAFHLLHKENYFSPNQKESEKQKWVLHLFPT